MGNLAKHHTWRDWNRMEGNVQRWKRGRVVQCHNGGGAVGQGGSILCKQDEIHHKDGRQLAVRVEALLHPNGRGRVRAAIQTKRVTFCRETE